jgi:hypothetical protein
LIRQTFLENIGFTVSHKHLAINVKNKGALETKHQNRVG